MSNKVEGKVVDTAGRTMRVAQITAFRRPLQVEEVPVAAPRADGAVVRVEASGVCRSDWHFWNQDLGWIGFNLPLPTVGAPATRWVALSRRSGATCAPSRWAIA